MSVDKTKGSQASQKGRTLLLVMIIALGASGVVFLSRWIDTHRASPQAALEDESLYLKGETARRISLGFNGLAADWYWMRSLQYVGKKIIKAREDLVIDDLRHLDLKLLAPLLDSATTLDPHFMEPYEYAALILPSIDLNEAIRITNKGIAANPDAWRLYHHLGYIYWQQQDYKTASQVYAQGAKISTAPPWMQAMSARMELEGGSRGVAREIYTRMYQGATDERVKELARRRLLQVDAFDQQDVLRQILSAYKSRLGRCPTSWNEIGPALKSVRWAMSGSGAPLDPGGTPYVLVQERCEPAVDPKSDVPWR